jgi:molybdopterin-guanine dinucleotide biosynthesis protein A
MQPQPRRYAPYADHLVSDDSRLPGHSPVFAPLAAAHNEHLLVLPCDVPNIDARLLTDLRKTAQRNPRLPVMVRHGEFWEPLICIIPTYLRTEVEHAWHAGERSPRKILLQLGRRAWNARQMTSSGQPEYASAVTAKV